MFVVKNAEGYFIILFAFTDHEVAIQVICEQCLVYQNTFTGRCFENGKTGS